MGSVIGDVLPLAGAADRWKETRLKKLLLSSPQSDELLRSQRPVRRHRQILALAGTAFARRVDETPQACQHRAVGGCRSGEPRIPLQRRMADHRPLMVVGGEQPFSQLRRWGRRLGRCRDGEGHSGSGYGKRFDHAPSIAAQLLRGGDRRWLRLAPQSPDERRQAADHGSDGNEHFRTEDKHHERLRAAPCSLFVP